MPLEWIYALASVMFVSLLAFLGILVLVFRDVEKIIPILISLAVGALYGDAFIHLIPESFKNGQNHLASVAVLAGLFVFFVLEKFLGWQHEHSAPRKKKIHPVGYMNLIADSGHNFVDGVVIGASYLVSIQLGLATTLAVVLHEIPHELSNFGILLYAGFSKSRALLFNFMSACFAILGTVVALYVGSELKDFSVLMVPFTAGGFIYIAGTDLLPELQKEKKAAKSIVQMISVAAGVGLMALLLIFESH